MAYASQSGRARVSAKNPQAFAVCQRCGIWYNRVDLKFQFDWRGAQLQNLYILVCDDCYDTPQEQLRAIVLPPDPVPIFYPSVEDFAADETDYRAVSLPPVTDPNTGIPIPSSTLRVTEDCFNRTTEPSACPDGLVQPAVMPWNGVAAYGVPLELLSVTSNGTATVVVTCSKIHGLVTNDQVSVEGLTDPNACGFYSVTVLTATTFSYMCYGSILANALLTPTSRIITCLIGLPLGYATIPQVCGPDLTIEQVCFLELEDGTGIFALESGAGYIELEACPTAPPQTYFFELENNGGVILLENGVDFLEQEDGP